MAIQILSTGLQTTVQDLGRLRKRHIGIPQSGAFDYLSAAKANAILGKSINSPVLECTMTGPTIKFLKDMQICVTGARVSELKIDDSLVTQDELLDLKKGNIFSMNHVKENLRFYIGFSEDIKATEFLGSVSTYLPAKLGGFNGGTIQKDQMIHFKKTTTEKYLSAPSSQMKVPFNTSIIRVVTGPEFNLLNMTANELEENDYIISNDSNRMGIRTAGKEIKIDDDGSMISKPIYPGMVQCPQNGLPIILGADAQTLGGYPRILQVIKADRHLLGQFKPNDRFRFNLISIAEAIDEWNTLKKAYPFICEL
ncbi:MAG: biotin-dependent carboxyltransferase family protein [Pseudomonadota bacterium]|nr:biotin-dependent carboxyltransferase family protein [Pseudomonadota bacterium]